MRHPHGLLRGEVAEELALARVQLGLAELAGAAVDAAAELLRHQVHAVADAERRHAEREQARVDRAARPSAYTEAGPPERITAAGLRRRTSSAVARCETSSE